MVQAVAVKVLSDGKLSGRNGCKLVGTAASCKLQAASCGFVHLSEGVTTNLYSAESPLH